jgi:arginine deiminase
MANAGIPISVTDDTGILRDALVQGPVCDLHGKTAIGTHGNARKAVRQHRRLVKHLENAGVTIRHLDRLLHSALEFADARDWILERRICASAGDKGWASDSLSWLSEQPPDSLTRYLMEGMKTASLPPALRCPGGGTAEKDGWFIAPLARGTYPCERLRVIEGGMVLCPPHREHGRNAAITAATVVNFAPLFDQSGVEFWLGADGADRSCPPINGHDLAVPGERLWVGAITRRTSVQALSLLASSLFRQNKAGTMFWLDLTGSACGSLDDCFLSLGPDCLLVDKKVLDRASAFIVRANHRGAVLAIEPCVRPFLAELGRVMGEGGGCMIDVNRFKPPVADALARLAPIVLAAGRIIAFEEHQAAFGTLERHGIEITASPAGDALSYGGKGPRGLIVALHIT